MNANYTIYGEWVGGNLTRYAAVEGDTWSYTVDNLPSGLNQTSWWGVDATLNFGSLAVSGDIWFWFLHDLWPYDFTIYANGNNYLYLYNSLFQDVHSDNSSYWTDEINAVKDNVNMSWYESYSIAVSGNTLTGQCVLADQTWDKERRIEVNLEKGLVTMLEVKMNSTAYEGMTADHIRVEGVTVPPSGDDGSASDSSGTPGFETPLVLIGIFVICIPILRRKRDQP